MTGLLILCYYNELFSLLVWDCVWGSDRSLAGVTGEVGHIILTLTWVDGA